MAGWSPSDPLPRSVTSRRYWAWAQISGDAEPAGLPFVNPMDAVAGSEPYGDAATAGSSQACSGTIPSPDVMDCMACSSDPAGAGRTGLQILLGPLAVENRPQVPGPLGGREPRGARRRTDVGSGT